MPLNLYGGPPGSGKTYQVVANIVVPQIEAGRTIITSIRNIRLEKIHEYLVSEKGAALEELGDLIVVTGDQIRSENFYPLYNEASEVFDDSESFVKNGMMVIIDEAYRYYGRGERLTSRTKQFFMEHRHSIDPETKQSCDIIMMCPDVADLMPTIKRISDAYFVCRKLKNLGMNSRFTVHQFIGKSRNPASTSTVQYEPKFFEFYDSYAGGKGEEKLIDSRQNLLHKPLIMIGCALLFASIAAYFVWRFFHPKPAVASKPSASASSPAGRSASSPDKSAKPENSSDKRITAWYRVGSQTVYLVQDHNNNFEPKTKGLRPVFGRHASSVDDERTVATWTGARSKDKTADRSPVPEVVK